MYKLGKVYFRTEGGWELLVVITMIPYTTFVEEVKEWYCRTRGFDSADISIELEQCDQVKYDG